MGREVFSLEPLAASFLRGAISELGRIGLSPIIISTRRTFAEQTILYRSWLDGTHPFPVAVPGTSRHEQGLAVDLKPSVPGCRGTTNEVMSRFSYRWAGPQDANHYDFIFGPGLRTETRVFSPQIAELQRIGAPTDFPIDPIQQFVIRQRT